MLYFTIFLLLLISDILLSFQSNNLVLKSEIQTIIDSAHVEGSVLIYDFQQDVYFSNDFEWANRGNLPASTFKIPNSLIALETGVVENDSTLFKWDGKKRWLKQWEQDLIFKEAFHLSCVPCYQDVAKRIGTTKMVDWLEKFNYGNMQVDSNNIDTFWLEGKSRISQFQQIDFLKRFYSSQLPISYRTKRIMKQMMVSEEKENYKLSGKTGLSVSNGINSGWYVGYVETGDKVFLFATNLQPKTRLNMDIFLKLRKEITYNALEYLSILKFDK